MKNGMSIEMNTEMSNGMNTGIVVLHTEAKERENVM